MTCSVCHRPVQKSDCFVVPSLVYGNLDPIQKLMGEPIHLKCLATLPEDLQSRVRNLPSLVEKVETPPFLCNICQGHLDPWIDEPIEVTAVEGLRLKQRIRFDELERLCVPAAMALSEYPNNGYSQCFHNSCLRRAGLTEKLALQAERLDAWGYDESQIEGFARSARNTGYFGGVSGRMSIEEIESEIEALVRSGIPRVGGTYALQNEG